MGTNYYFRKKTIDPKRIEAIVDSLNNDFKDLVTKYNEKLHEVFSEMGIDNLCEFDDYHTFISPVGHSDYDIHVGKLSCGWKPLMQATEYFHSVETLKQWYEENKSDYNFINEYDEVASFEDYIEEIARRNSDDSLKGHEEFHQVTRSDSYDWTYTQFS